jgi:hypothetical protein
MMPGDSGRKEIAEAVLIAAFSAIVTKLVEWGFEKIKRRREKKSVEIETEESTDNETAPT